MNTRDDDVHAATLLAVQLLLRNRDYADALAEIDKAIEQVTPRCDVAGMNPEAETLAIAFAVQACPAFMPSRHANARHRTSGANVRCIQCRKPQHQHWLRQALSGQSR